MAIVSVGGGHFFGGDGAMVLRLAKRQLIMHYEGMSEKRLRTGILGLKDRGESLLEALARSEHFELVAVADDDGEVVEKAAQVYGCGGYDDYRQFLIANEFDCLLVAAGLHSCVEHIKAAIKGKVNVLKLAPLARNFEEAVELVRLAETENVKFGVGNIRRFSSHCAGFRGFVEEHGGEGVLLFRSLCMVGSEGRPNWQNDPKQAGGGVVLNDCYGMIDQIVWSFGMPQEVYAVCGSAAGDRQQRQYLTEDTAVLTMKFGGGFAGSLIGSRCQDFGAPCEYLEVYGQGWTARVSEKEFLVTDSAGVVRRNREVVADVVGCLGKLLGSFGLSVLWPGKYGVLSSGRENLKDMAVIESAYLSSRTGFPEEPVRVLQMVGLEPAGM